MTLAGGLFKVAVTGLALLAAMLPAALTADALQARTRMTVLDVEEGQAVLLSAGDQAVLIDTGHAGQAARVLDKLRARGVKQLAYVVLTHLHPDHASGLFRIREAFPGVPVYTSCHPLPADVQPDMTRWVVDYLRNDPQHHCMRAGDHLQFADTRLDLLWPHRFRNNNLNAHSLVIHIHDEHHNILLMGDAGLQAERALMRRQALPEAVDWLVVGHHGAADASGEAFLRHIEAERAVISVNKDNLRGYPAAQVVDRLEALGVRLQRTDIDGDIDL